jgi:hypothetical protein
MNIEVPSINGWEVLDDIVQFGLVVGVRVDEEISSGQNHLEAKEHIDVIGG